MREKIQQKSSVEEPCEKAPLGVVSSPETENSQMPYELDCQATTFRQEATGSAGGTGRITEGSQSVDRLNFSFTLSGFLVLFIWIYRKTLSPWLPPCCRFTPTCSHYAIEAIRKHGAWKGMLLGAWRIMKCQPFCKGGYDPVPEPKMKKKQLTTIKEEVLCEI